jgi:small subunit ribosomal protein S4
MARYIGPVCRICRRAGEKLFLKGTRCYTPKCEIDKRNKPPGQTVGRRRRRVSDRGAQLRQKQNARFTYGTLERQFRKTFTMAEKQPGVTGDSLMVLLERRLDNVIYRLGFADSRKQARQVVRHGHIVVNGRKTNIPSYLVKEGDTIGWREGSRKTEYFKTVAASIEARTVQNWLSLDRQNLVGQVISLPTPEQIGATFDAKAITEYYSR